MNESNKNYCIEELCYNLYLKNERNFKIFNECCLYLNIPLDVFFKNVVDYINQNKVIPEFVKILNKLTDITEKEQVVEYLKNIPLDYKILRTNLMSYFINYRPDIYYSNEILKKTICDNLTFFETYIAKSNKPCNCELKDINEVAKEIITDYVNSNYSINRFCYNKNITSTNFKKYVQIVKKNYPELYEIYIESTNKKDMIKNSTIQNDVYNILEKIKENPEFSIIDYLLITNYDVFEIIAIADNILSFDDIKLIRRTIRPIRYVNRLCEKQVTNIINSNFVFNINDELIALTKDDIIVILEFLKEKNIPLSNESFNDACIKYLNKKLKKECSK